MLVVNCANIEKNFDWIIANKPENVDFANISSTIDLIALQGPKSKDILSKYTDVDLNDIDYYHFCIANICGFPVTLSRTCLLYTSPSPRDKRQSRMPSSA